MSEHEGVSCDYCRKSNFRGKRYKCLVCNDYDLCSTCYEAGTVAQTSRHSMDHPVQCILTRTDAELYFGGETISTETPHSYTCPICGRMGFTEHALYEHATSEHGDCFIEVACPICSALPSSEPNQMTDDFASHIQIEHRPQATGSSATTSSSNNNNSSNSHNGNAAASSGSSNSMATSQQVSSTSSSATAAAASNSNNNNNTGSAGAGNVDDGQAPVRGRRAPHPHPSRGMSSSRARRTQMQFSTGGGGGLPNLSPSARESMDPIAELLSQLSGVRRAANLGPGQSHLQQLQMQLQLERGASAAAAAAGASAAATFRQQVERQQNDRLIRRHTQQSNAASGGVAAFQGQLPYVVLMEPQSGHPVIASPASGFGAIPNSYAYQSYAQVAAATSNTAVTTNTATNNNASQHNQYLIQTLTEMDFDEKEQQQLELQRSEKSLFVQELLLTTLSRYKDTDDSNSDSKSRQEF